MGRGGGGGGGGSHSFGGSSGRSFGGSSSSSHRGGGGYRSTSSRTSSYHSSPHIHVSNNYYGGYGYRRHYYSDGSGLALAIMMVIVFFLVIFVLAASDNNIAKSTVEREKLKPYASFDKGAIDDDAGWITDVKTLQKGMESFYKDTGIQPALAIYEEIDGKKYLSNSEIEAFMNDEYDDLVGHERGVLLLFCEYETSDYYAYYLVGEDAQTVMDSEAEDILMDYVHDLYTNNSYSDEEYFAAVFKKTGERIMTVTPTFASKIPVIVGGIVIICAMGFGVKALKAKHKRDAEKAKETERILNTHIDRI